MPEISEKFGIFVLGLQAFPHANKALIGDGFEGIERILNFWDYIDKAHIVYCPDTHCGDMVNYLKKKNYAVAGVGKAEQLELDRWKGRQIQKEIGLPTQGTVKITGLDALRKYLEKNKNKFIKLNIFRGDIECADEQTEILTDKGWLFLKDLSNEKVLSMNLSDRNAKFVSVKSYFKSYYDGLVYQIKGKKIDALVTPNHKFFATTAIKQKRSGCKWKYLPISKLSNYSFFFVPISSHCSGEIIANYKILPAVKKTYKEQSRTVRMRDWLRFIGWFLAEGSLSDRIGKKKWKYRIVISQSKIKNNENWKEIKLLIEALGYNCQKEGNLGWSIYSKSLYEELVRTCYSSRPCNLCGKSHCSHLKKVPDYVKILSPDLISAMLETYQKGDGNNDRGHVNFYTTSNQLANDVQELLFRTDKSGVIHKRTRDNKNWNPCYIVSASDIDDCLVKKENIKPVDYKGFVYDVTVEPYHSILLRRNGKAYWSGNSFRHIDYESSEPLLDHLAYELGPKQEHIDFVVEDEIEGVEPGLDGIVFDGKNLSPCMVGYEIKGGGYVGSVMSYDKVCPQLKKVNDSLAPIFERLKTRFFFSTEVIIPDRTKGYLIDYTIRHAAPCVSAIQSELIENFSEVIYGLATGEVIEPVMKYKYAAGVSVDSSWAEDHWLKISFPDKMRKWFKMRMACRFDKNYYAVPGFSSLGSVIALGSSVNEVFETIKQRIAEIKAFGADSNLSCFEDMQKEIDEGRKIGIRF